VSTIASRSNHESDHLSNDTVSSRSRSEKRIELIRHLKKNDAFLLREGKRHSIFQRGAYKTEVPRHREIVDELA